MLKKEVFKVEDSNVAGLGSDLDKKCRSDAAATEKAWAKAGKKPGMQIWRIEKFKVKKSMTPIGTFYNDDSYICLNTYKCKDMDGNETDKLGWDIHFWLGLTTSQDEYGTAAYKTVELDDFLGGGPVQHRECSGFESTLFLSYFKEFGGITLLEGGMESGFNIVKPEEFRPRLLHLKGVKNVRIEEVPLAFESLNDGDGFIVDAGLNIYQFQGKKAGKNEKARAGQLCRAIDDERKGKPEVMVYSQTDSDVHEFYQQIQADFKKGDPIEISAEGGSDAAHELSSHKALYKLSDSSGTLTFSLIAEKSVKKGLLDTNDVFVFDIGSEIFVWVGHGASADEKKGAMGAAQTYLKEHDRPAQLSITKVLEGADNNQMNSSWDK